MRGTVSGFVTGLCLIAVFAFGATLVTRLPERLKPPMPIADPPVTQAAQPAPAPSVPQETSPVVSAPDSQPPKLALAPSPQAQRPASPSLAPKPPLPAGLPVPEVGLLVDLPSDIQDSAGDAPRVPTGDAPVTADRESPLVVQPQTGSAAQAPAAPPVSAEPPELVATAPDEPTEAAPLAQVSGGPAAPVDQPRPDIWPLQPDLAIASPPDSGISAEAQQPHEDAAPNETLTEPVKDTTATAQASAADDATAAVAPDTEFDAGAVSDATLSAATEAGGDAQAPAPGTRQQPAEVAQDAPTDTAPETAPDVAQQSVPEPEPEAPVVAQDTTPQPAQPSPIVRNPVLDRDDSAPRIGTRVSNLIDRRDAVPVRRPGLTEATLASETRVTGDVPMLPLDQFRVPVVVEPGQGRLAIVLVHDGVSRIRPEAFEGFPFPMTIAVDHALGDAPEVMRAYRALGHEVVALVDVPPATTRFDAELAVQSVLNTLPEVVGIMEGGADGIQKNRDVAEQVALLLQATGHGLLLRSTGLNTLEQFATREGVPTTTVFRDVDGSGQNQRAIRRFLDQAAFRARQGDSVVVQARVRPNTLDALWVWAFEGRTSQTALVPMSEVWRPGRGAQ